MAVPAAGFNPFVGQSGDFKAAILTDDSNVDFQVIPTGSAFVAVKAAVTTFLGGVKWQLGPNKLNVAKFLGFNSPTGIGGAISPLQMKGGVDDWGVTLEKILDGNSATGLSTNLRLPKGCFIYFQCLCHKSQNYGVDGFARVLSFETSSDATKTDTPLMVSIQLAGHGALPTFGTIT